MTESCNSNCLPAVVRRWHAHSEALGLVFLGLHVDRIAAFVSLMQMVEDVAGRHLSEDGGWNRREPAPDRAQRSAQIAPGSKMVQTETIHGLTAANTKESRHGRTNVSIIIPTLNVLRYCLLPASTASPVRPAVTSAGTGRRRLDGRNPSTSYSPQPRRRLIIHLTTPTRASTT